MSKDVCVVLGTYNRDVFVRQAVESVRACADGVSYEIAVVDGGSTDGSINWLETQSDVVLFRQQLPLTGAVRAFNIGFAHAVDSEARYAFHFNDDARLVTPGSFKQAVDWMDKIPKIGEIAFEFNLRGGWGFEEVNGHLYANFGMIRREAGMAVAREQGDPSGRAWWNPIYRTYGADCEFGVHLWRLGWVIHPAPGLRVDDLHHEDALRELNQANNPERADSRLFWERFANWRGHF